MQVESVGGVHLQPQTHTGGNGWVVVVGGTVSVTVVGGTVSVTVVRDVVSKVGD